MNQVISMEARAGGFDSVAQADRAIRTFMAAGFTTNQIVVLCPAKFQSHFANEIPKAETPASPDAGEALATGGLVGASIGGLALAATVLTGGVGGVMAAALVGGGALAGGFSNLIVSKGYDTEAVDFYKQAVDRGLIVVGVEVSTSGQLAEAERILKDAGAIPLKPI